METTTPFSGFIILQQLGERFIVRHHSTRVTGSGIDQSGSSLNPVWIAVVFTVLIAAIPWARIGFEPKAPAPLRRV